jgi:hypothetical protein
MDVIYDNDSWSPTLLDVVQQTFRVLSQCLPVSAELDAEMRLDLTETLIEVSRGHTLILVYSLMVYIRDLFSFQ